MEKVKSPSRDLSYNSVPLDESSDDLKQLVFSTRFISTTDCSHGPIAKYDTRIRSGNKKITGSFNSPIVNLTFQKK